MGDLASSKKNTTNQATTNQQVALQNDRGGAGAGISGSTLTNSTVNVVSSDPDVVLGALAAMNHAGDNEALVALNAANASFNTANRALETLENVSMQTGQVLDNANARASDIALRATPISGGEIAEINKQSSNELLLKGGLAIAALYLSTKLLKN